MSVGSKMLTAPREVKLNWLMGVKVMPGPILYSLMSRLLA